MGVTYCGYFLPSERWATRGNATKIPSQTKTLYCRHYVSMSELQRRCRAFFFGDDVVTQSADDHPKDMLYKFHAIPMTP